jgi:hypothetical protein
LVAARATACASICLEYPLDIRVWRNHPVCGGLSRIIARVSFNKLAKHGNWINVRILGAKVVVVLLQHIRCREQLLETSFIQERLVLRAC